MRIHVAEATSQKSHQVNRPVWVAQVPEANLGLFAYSLNDRLSTGCGLENWPRAQVAGKKRSLAVKTKPSFIVSLGWLAFRSQRCRSHTVMRP